MEGDGPTGSVAIPEYLKLRNHLKKKANLLHRSNPLRPMFIKMLGKTETYLKEALIYETLVISTILNPLYRLAIFETHFPNKEARVKRRLVELFEERKD
jgi:hypothetical protein